MSTHEKVVPLQKKLNETRRFQVYVHSKMMIVDDDYIILGSANLNERSMAGDRDTEIAIGAYQPDYFRENPKGDIHKFRLSIWLSHMGRFDPLFLNPNTIECVSKVNEIASRNWQNFANFESLPLDSYLLKYPVIVNNVDGSLTPERSNFPDTFGPILGSSNTSIPRVVAY